MACFRFASEQCFCCGLDQGKSAFVSFTGGQRDYAPAKTIVRQVMAEPSLTSLAIALSRLTHRDKVFHSCSTGPGRQICRGEVTCELVSIKAFRVGRRPAI